MNIDHMVWFKFREGVSEARMAEHCAALAALNGRIPGVLALRIGRNFTDRARGFTHGLLVTLDSRESLKGYLEHPEHVRAAMGLRADAEIMALDIETA